MISRLLLAVLLGMAASLAQAQTPPPADQPAAPDVVVDELEPAVNTSGPPPAASNPATSDAREVQRPAPRGRVIDRVELEATQITGNRELPKVLYIVPWKRPDLGDLGGRPINSLLDEVLAPVDRDVFRRENRYFDAVKPDTAPVTPAAGMEMSAQPEK